VTVSNAIARDVPALFTSTSTLPKSATTVSYVREMSAALETSQT